MAPLIVQLPPMPTNSDGKVKARLSELILAPPRSVESMSKLGDARFLKELSFNFSGSSIELQAVVAMIKELGFRYVSRQLDQDGEPTSCFILEPPSSPNTELDIETDFHDKSRELENALDALIHEIRAINDPDKKDVRIKQLQIYAEGIKRFVDQSLTDQPVPVPAEMAEGFTNRSSRIDWTQISEHANKWAALIVKILQGLT